MSKPIEFNIENDKNYILSFASGVEVSSINDNRADLSFFYEKVHTPRILEGTISEDGKLELNKENNSKIEIDRIISATITIDRNTAESLITSLNNWLKDKKE